MLKFNLKSFIIFLSLLLVEIIIAVFAHDAFIRPIFGDFLSVIVLYYFFDSFFRINKSMLIFACLIFAYFIETLQYLNFLAYSGLQKHRIIAIILGSSFSWGDILAYTLGALFLVFLNKPIPLTSDGQRSALPRKN